MQLSQSSFRNVIGVMGEFSVGKSTLCNLILGTKDLPEMVTATQLPPIWFTKGTAKDVLVLKDGLERVLDDGFDPDTDLTAASHLLLQRDFPILDIADIVDFPGISDPNMDASVWQRLLPQMDAVLWLTHATQAWRQSEAAVWKTVDAHVRAKSALIVTQIDKLVSETDKSRILKRLNFEAGDGFSEIIPVSLSKALLAGDDLDSLEASGAVDLYKFILQFENESEPEQETAPHALSSVDADIAPNAKPDIAALSGFENNLPEQDYFSPRDNEVDAATSFDEQSKDAELAPAVNAQQERGPNVEDAHATYDPGSDADIDTPDRVKPRRVKPRGKSRRTRLEKPSDETLQTFGLEAFAVGM